MIETTEFKDKLEAELTRITADLSSIASYDEATDNWEAVPDSDSQDEADINVEADATEEWNERRATLSALETEYRDTKRALTKIDNGTYGHCEVCQAEIATPRLTFKPTARTCQDHLNDEATLSL
jgi:DnaK suppressor protein